MAGDANASKGQRLGVSFAYLSTVVCYRREVGRDQPIHLHYLIEKGKAMEEQGYNGWSNRETWATMLHIDNDQGLFEIAMDYARTAIEEHPKDEEDAGADYSDALYCLEDTLKYWIEEDLLTRENIAGNEGLWLMLSDIGSLYRINYREIADSLISNVMEEKRINA